MSSPKSKILVSVLIILALVAALSGGVYAYLSASTGPVENNFTVAPTHTIDIEEDFRPDDSNPVKKDVCVDVGKPGYAVYVRVAVIATWRNDAGQVHSQSPTAGIDYALDLNEVAWFKADDGFYYLGTMFVGDNENLGKTPVLINSCYQQKEGPTDYNLHIEIIAQTIQAKGSTDKVDANGKPIPAVTDAWGIEVNQDDTLKKPVTNP